MTFDQVEDYILRQQTILDHNKVQEQICLFHAFDYAQGQVINYCFYEQGIYPSAEAGKKVKNETSKITTV